MRKCMNLLVQGALLLHIIRNIKMLLLAGGSAHLTT